MRLLITEETAVFERYVTPHLKNLGDSLGVRKTAYEVFVRKPEDILLISGTELAFGATVAGLTEAMAEVLLRHGTRSQKEGLADFLSDEEALNEAMKVAEDMDDDEEARGSTKHRERVARVIRYLRDNEMVIH